MLAQSNTSSIKPLLLLAFLFVIGVGTSFAVNAQTLEEEQQALKVAKAQAEEAKQRSEKLDQQAQKATKDADRYNRRAAALAARIQSSEASLAASEARIAIVERLQRQQRARLANQQGPIVRLTAALQNMSRKPTALTLVQPGSLEDLVHVRSILASVLPQVEKQTAGLRAEVERGRQLRQQSEKAVTALKESRETLATRRNELRRLEAKQRVAATQFAGDAGLEQERSIALGEEARDIVDLMAQIRDRGSVRERLATLDGPKLRPAQPGETVATAKDIATTANADPAYRLPVVGEIVTGLGEVSESGVRARGITIATRPSAQVIAPANGRVAYAGTYRGYGRIVIIEHDGGWTSLITSMHKVSVNVGQQVVQGAPIGSAGRSRPTITVELRRNGRPIDIARLVS